MTFSEEFESIKAAIYDRPWDDPGRLETCLSIALEALGDMASRDECLCSPLYPYNPECRVLHVSSASAAQDALRRMEMRVRLGDDQPAGADITYPWEDVLSPGPDGGDWG